VTTQDRESGERSEHATSPVPVPRQGEGAQRARPESSAGGDKHEWGPLVDDLAQRRQRALEMGGVERVERQHALGKLTVRERLDLLLDPGSWVEYGLLADHMDAGLGDRYLAADGAITGVGLIDGRPVAVAAYDFTVMAGSMGRVGEDKIKRLRAHAVAQRMPMIWLLDSAGARIQATSGSSFAGTGDLFREQVAMSGVVPMVAAMLGHCAAGTAYIPALADFVPMVKGTSSMALGGRHLVKAAVGEDVTEDEMGGSAVHTKISGVADLEVADDRECLATVRRYLAFFPAHNGEAPPTRACTDPVARRVDELYDIVPTAPRRAYDVRKVVTAIVDDGDVLWMKPEWAKNIVTGFARIGGAPIGVVANQPMVLGGALDVNAADKAARFVWLCDAFNIPLVFLHDVPGFIVGSAVEKQGIIRHGAKMLFAVSEATVPKISVVMRKSYGAGYFVMNGLAYEADYIVAWPTAEIAVMGPDGAVAIIHRRTLEAVPEEERAQKRLELAEEIRANIDPYVAAGHGQLDDVIDPADTRLAIARGLRVAAAKQVARPWRKHGVLPV